MSNDTAPAVDTELEPALADAVRVADAFIAGCNDLDDARRRELIATTWTADGHYVDPLHEATGHGQLDALFDQVHVAYPGHAFTRTSAVQRVGRWFRFSWDLRGPDGALLAAGTDTGELVDGALARIVSFYDHLAV
jgi:hypothetical protein